MEAIEMIDTVVVNHEPKSIDKPWIHKKQTRNPPS